MTNMIKNLFVPYNIAAMAKEHGFNEFCFGYYNSQEELRVVGIDYRIHKEGMVRVLAPLYQQLTDWFRNKYGLIIYVCQTTLPDRSKYYSIIQHKINTETYFDYYEAYNKAFEETFKLIKYTQHT